MSATAVYPVWVVPRIMVRFPGMDTIYFSTGTLFRYTLEDIMSRYHIDTWADGHGLWHALVRDPQHDTFDRLTDSNVRNIRDAGKRAILREIREREESPTRPGSSIVTAVRVNWDDCRQHGSRAYVGSPDTLHIAEVPA